MTKEIVQRTEISVFIGLSKQQQRALMAKLSIHDFKNEEDRPLLKKFIAMKVLMEARHAAEDQSPFNLTAQFRNLLAFFGLNELVLGADNGTSWDRTLYPGEYQQATNGYRLFHISEMGMYVWNRKFFTWVCS